MQILGLRIGVLNQICKKKLQENRQLKTFHQVRTLNRHRSTVKLVVAY